MQAHQGFSKCVFEDLRKDILFYIPHNAISKFNITDSKDLADAENSYHATVAQIVDNLQLALGFISLGRKLQLSKTVELQTGIQDTNLEGANLQGAKQLTIDSIFNNFYWVR